jgi:hypothetical protein
LSTDTALETFGFRRLHQAVLACLRRQRDRTGLDDEHRRAAEAAAARIERLAASLSKSAVEVIDVSFDSPRGMLSATPGVSGARVRLRIGGRPRNLPADAPPPLTLDVDPADPLVNPKVAVGGMRVDIAPPGLGRLARTAATDGAGFRPPALSPETLITAARAHAAGSGLRVTTLAVDDKVQPQLRTCPPEGLAALLLACCWPQLTPEDPKSTWVIHLSRPSNPPDAQPARLARHDRGSRSVLIDKSRLDADDDRAVTALVAALRTAGRDPGDRYWTNHRTMYPAGFASTAP